MNLLLLAPEEVEHDGSVWLDDRRAEHLRKVLRVEAGRLLRAGVLGGRCGTAEVQRVAADGVALRLTLDGPPSPAAVVDLIVALPRPQALHRTLQLAAAMGVGRLDLIRSWRVEKSFFSSPSLAPDAIRRHLLLGAEQGMITRLPSVHIHHRFKPFLDELDPATGALRLLAHPEAALLEAVWPQEASGRLTVAIGPEGGWIDREVASFRALGFLPFSLGPWILRVEAAVAAALAQLALLKRVRET